MTTEIDETARNNGDKINGFELRGEVKNPDQNWKEIILVVYIENTICT